MVEPTYEQFNIKLLNYYCFIFKICISFLNSSRLLFLPTKVGESVTFRRYSVAGDGGQWFGATALHSIQIWKIIKPIKLAVVAEIVSELVTKVSIEGSILVSSENLSFQFFKAKWSFILFVRLIVSASPE